RYADAIATAAMIKTRMPNVLPLGRVAVDAMSFPSVWCCPDNPILDDGPPPFKVRGPIDLSVRRQRYAPSGTPRERSGYERGHTPRGWCATGQPCWCDP